MNTTIHERNRSNIPAAAPVFYVLFLVCYVSACAVEPEDSGGGITVSLFVYGEERPRYFSLSGGTEITDPGLIASAAWDIALESHDSSFFVLTNSGVTAADLGSGGNGAVWHTGKTDFASVVLADAVTNPPEEYRPYTQDVRRWAIAMGADPVRETLNVMTYLGYPGGDAPETNGETEATPFQRLDPVRDSGGGMDPAYKPYLFNKKQFYEMRGMPPTYIPTGQVYVIRHGDGKAHSKFQIPDGYLEYNPQKPLEAFFVLRFIHEQFASE
jgi:hypothetical protein